MLPSSTDGLLARIILDSTRKIEIPRLLWMNLVGDLSARGRGQRESGAFLMGKKGAPKRSVVRYICYDDLDPRALTHGLVEFHSGGFSKLWDICRDQGLQVLVDVHTHPGKDVRQSTIDKENPMLPVRGHVALILPRFGKTSVWSLDPIGIHRFTGGRQWESFRSFDQKCPVRLSLW